MDTAYISYSKRSSTTGRELFKLLKANKTGGFNWRRCNKKEPTKSYKVMLRWGNSLSERKENSLELNDINDSISAINKLKMAKAFVGKGVKIPTISFNEDGEISTLSYIRGKEGTVRLGDSFFESDLYATEMVDKDIELRIHIFNGRTIGVYEKIPNEDSDLILKDNNSTFRRLDMSIDENKDRIKGARPLAVKAVESLGMLFGGVDIIKSTSGEWYALEVNSSPALNTPNVERYVNEIEKYLINSMAD